MRRSLALAFLTVAVVAPLRSAQENGTDLKQRQQVFMHHIKSEGFVPEIDKDGDIVFKIEGGTYYIVLHENDPEFFQMIFPSFWEIENDAERLKALDAANHSNAKSKVSKVMVLGDNVFASIEILLTDPSDFETVFGRCVGLLRNGVNNFKAKMREDGGGRESTELPVPPAPAPPAPPLPPSP
jgi:hypothetical protein